MVSIPCTIRHITLIEVTNGIKYTGPINWEGIEVGGVQGESSNEDNQRSYLCTNCMINFDGTETFDICKAHLGTFPLD